MKQSDYVMLETDLKIYIEKCKKLELENKQQKEQLCNRSDCSGRIIDSNKCDSLQQRIDKAIEYIKHNGEKQYNIHDNYRGKWYSPDDLDNLLDILRGDGNE